MAIAGEPLSLERLTGWAFSPFAWIIGIPWNEAQHAGALLGTKVILNELLAATEKARAHAELSRILEEFERALHFLHTVVVHSVNPWL